MNDIWSGDQVGSEVMIDVKEMNARWENERRERVKDVRHMRGSVFATVDYGDA